MRLEEPKKIGLRPISPFELEGIIFKEEGEQMNTGKKWKENKYFYRKRLFFFKN
jgi:hypothetical protein